jgi:hypothetical protein
LQSDEPIVPSVLSNKARKHSKEYQAERDEKMKKRELKKEQAKSQARLDAHMANVRLASSDDSANETKTILMAKLAKNGLVRPAASTASSPVAVTPNKHTTMALKRFFKGNGISAKIGGKRSAMVKTLENVKSAAKEAGPSAPRWQAKVQQAVCKTRAFFGACIAPSVLGQ